MFDSIKNTLNVIFGKEAELQSYQEPEIIDLYNTKADKQEVNGDWFLVGDSVAGRSHVSNNVPCQDSHFYKTFSAGWGIAISCDGAGSAENSHIGSAFLAKEALPRYFEELFEKSDWRAKSILPTQAEWQLEARKGFEFAYGALKIYSQSKEYEFSSLAATAIVIIYSPIGLLLSHIGDGRAGFLNELDDWQPLMTPHKGEEANQTIFVTSSAWLNDPTITLSEKEIPESRVVYEKPKAFAIMSDGCEQHSFNCSHFDNDTQIWSDPNIPYAKFFNPLVELLRNVATKAETNLEINNSWRSFLEAGTNGLRNETDDKTMILGVLI